MSKNLIYLSDSNFTVRGGGRYGDKVGGIGGGGGRIGGGGAKSGVEGAGSLERLGREIDFFK